MKKERTLTSEEYREHIEMAMNWDFNEPVYHLKTCPVQRALNRGEEAEEAQCNCGFVNNIVFDCG